VFACSFSGAFFAVVVVYGLCVNVCASCVSVSESADQESVAFVYFEYETTIFMRL
jgi:disulfide oxidoreductase YuzD